MVFFKKRVCYIIFLFSVATIPAKAKATGITEVLNTNDSSLSKGFLQDNAAENKKKPINVSDKDNQEKISNKWKLWTSYEILSETEFEKTKLGGFSGLNCQESDCFIVSDDRGAYGEPRILNAEIKILPNQKMSFIPKKWIFPKQYDSPLSHPDVKNTQIKKMGVLDLEGIAYTPWDSFLLISEGDFNQHPRQQPRFFEIKKDGSFVKDYSIENDVKVNPTRKQKYGARNNRAFEGLSKHPSDNCWVVALEAPLLQGAKDWIPFSFYNLPKAWSVELESTKYYPYEADQVNNISYGVSDLLWLEPQELLVLERRLKSDLSFDVKIFQTKIENKMKKSLVWDGLDLNINNEKNLANFEGIALGPMVEVEKNKFKRSIFLISDNNFKSYLKTLLVVLVEL